MTGERDRGALAEILERLRTAGDAADRNASARRDHEAAWTDLARHLRVHVASVSRRLDLPWVEPEDLMQMVLAKLLHPGMIDRLRETSAPTAYLHTLVRNVAYDALRREARRAVHLDEYRRTLGPEQPMDHLRDVTGLTTTEERLIALRLALLGLSDADRLLLRRRFWEGQPTGVVAQELGITYSAAAVRLHRLLRRLRALIEQQADSDADS